MSNNNIKPNYLHTSFNSWLKESRDSFFYSSLYESWNKKEVFEIFKHSEWIKSVDYFWTRSTDIPGTVPNLFIPNLDTKMFFDESVSIEELMLNHWPNDLPRPVNIKSIYTGIAHGYALKDKMSESILLIQVVRTDRGFRHWINADYDGEIDSFKEKSQNALLRDIAFDAEYSEFLPDQEQIDPAPEEGKPSQKEENPLGEIPSLSFDKKKFTKIPSFDDIMLRYKQRMASRTRFQILAMNLESSVDSDKDIYEMFYYLDLF